MNRAANTNGSTAETVRAKGGYDAYFAPVADQAEPAKAGSGEGAESGATTSVPPVSDTETRVTPDSTPARSTEAPTVAEPPRSAPGVDSPAPRVQPSAPSGAAMPPTAAGPYGAGGYGAFADMRSNQAGPNPAASPGRREGVSPAVASPPPAQPVTNAQPVATAESNTRAGNAGPRTGAVGSATPGPAAAPAPPAASATTARSAETPTATWQSDTTVQSASWTGGPAGGDATVAAWSQADPAGAAHHLPDRQSPADAGARIEVLPAALTSMDLLADITAAHRAQLKSTSGVRGALNKVGFNLGLSPAEQRTESRRGRIRRQLTSPYQIAIVSVKGGVGRTTVSAALGSTFAALRPDRVVAVDGNPDFGDLPARTAPHQYGLTLRDMVRAGNLEAFSAVHSFTSINNADLAVLASPWTTESVEALSGREYHSAVQTLRRHYNLVLVDCGTGVLDSITQTVLQTSDAVVVVTPSTVGGVKGAVATLNWLNSHGLQHLIASSVVAIVQQQATKPIVEVSQIEKLFAGAQRPTLVVPYDEHLAEGGEIDLRLLDKETLLSFEELAATLGDGFPRFPGAERGGRR